MVERLRKVQRGLTELMHRIKSNQTGYTDLTIDAKSKLIDIVSSPTTWTCAEHFEKFLDPFKRATVMMSAGTYLTLSMVALVYRSLRKHVQISKESAAGNEVFVRFMDAVDAKLQAYDQLTVTRQVKIAKALDPRFKRSIRRLGFDAVEVRRMVHEEYTCSYEDDYLADIYHQHNETSSPLEDRSLSSAMEIFQNEIGEDDVFESELEPFSTELERWFTSPALKLDYGCRSILTWFRANKAVYPRIAFMARDYLAVTSTSVPSEEVFSKAGCLIRDRRARLGDKTVRAVMELQSFEKYIV